MNLRLYPIIVLLALCGCAGVGTSPAPVEERSQTEVPGQDTESLPGDDEKAGPVVDEKDVHPTPVMEKQTASGDPATTRANTPDEPVVLAALDEAETLAARGNAAMAMASLERGIRIKPKDPWLWHQLGVLKLRSGQWLDAIAIAEKSNSLAGQNRQLLIGNWLVIAEAREALGELSAAEQARQTAESLTGH